MNSVRELRVPLLISGGAVVVALVIWLALISPQNTKLSSLQAKQSQLTSQQVALQVKLASLKSEKQKLVANCSDLQKIATQIPSVQSPTDVDAEESSFESQFNALTGASGVTLIQFSGFTPATAATTTPTTTKGSSTPPGVTAVPTTIAVTGSYGQITSFINGLDSFPRLFVIQNFVLSRGVQTASTTASTTVTAATSSTGAPTPGTPPLWTGGAPNAASVGPYSLQITGSIYYTSAPSALDVCTKATASLK